MTTFIAGLNAPDHDKSDWDINQIPVYVNLSGLPETTSKADAIRLVRQSILSWALRYHVPMVYEGETDQKVMPGTVVINWTSGVELSQMYGKDINGLCRYKFKPWNGIKHIMDSCELHVNRDSRPLANDYLHATILHELGHACGIHSHIEQDECVMSHFGSRGRTKLTLHDMQALDQFNPYPIELHHDMSMSIPAAHHPDGRVLFIHLPYNGQPLIHSWKLGDDHQWDGPKLNNVTVTGEKMFYTQWCSQVSMKQICGLDLTVSANLLLAPNGNLILEHAE